MRNAVPCSVHEYVHASVARVAPEDVCHYATQCIVTLTHVGRLSVIHVPHAVVQTKHGRSTLGLLTAGALCRARLGYASSFRSGCAAPRLSSLEPVSSSLRTPCRSSPQMPASGQSRSGSQLEELARRRCGRCLLLCIMSLALKEPPFRNAQLR